MSRRLAEVGFEVVHQSAEADLYVLNTCSVTHVADAKGRQWLGGARRRNPQAKVIATGCYATRATGEVEALESVDTVVLNRDKGRLAEVASELMADWEEGAARSPIVDARGVGRCRAFVKIQDGCNQFCAFCVIPMTRGREFNVPLEQALADIRARVDEGFKEVVITGPQIGSYGQYPPTVEFRRDPEGIRWSAARVDRANPGGDGTAAFEGLIHATAGRDTKALEGVRQSSGVQPCSHSFAEWQRHRTQPHGPTVQSG